MVTYTYFVFFYCIILSNSFQESGQPCFEMSHEPHAEPTEELGHDTTQSEYKNQEYRTML